MYSPKQTSNSYENSNNKIIINEV